jgi:hypothetical protein
MICKWIKVFYNNFEKSKVISWPIFVTLYLAPATPNKKIKLTTENQEVNERTAEENNDNAEFEIHLSICVLLFFSVTYLNTSIFAMNKNSKSTHFGILNTKFGTLVFFYIVPVPFVPSRNFSNCPDPVCPVPKNFRDSPVCPAGRDKRDFSGFGTVPQISNLYTESFIKN